jgi:hypothetical protein
MIASNYQSSASEGQVGENLFANIAADKGFRVNSSSERENIYDHIDFHVTRNAQTWSVDVKTVKRTSRHQKYKDNAIWVELKNVSGNTGWLYGKQDCIAFQQDEEFILVSRRALAHWIEQRLDFSQPLVHSPQEASYRLYQRKGRQDLITKIQTNDLRAISHRIWSTVPSPQGFVQ